MKNDIRHILAYLNKEDMQKFNEIKEILKSSDTSSLGIMEGFNSKPKVIEIFKKMFGIKKDEASMFHEAKLNLERFCKNDTPEKQMLEKILNVLNR